MILKMNKIGINLVVVIIHSLIEAEGSLESV